MALLVLSVMPGVLAAGIGTGLGGDIGVEEFVPIVWQCGDRKLTDENIQPWRFSGEGDFLGERNNNYLFEGEKYQVDVVVFDKNKIQDVVVDLLLGSEAGDDDYSVNCVPKDVDPRFSGCKTTNGGKVCFDKCNARIDEEALDKEEDYDPAVMQGYQCTVTIQDSEHMEGEFWMSVRATDKDGEDEGIYDEVAKWWLNPTIELAIDGALDFDEVRPGTSSYSTVLIGNEAEGGVVLDMFITGKNWQSADEDLGRCKHPTTGELVNYLPLEAFSYYAENGAYDTRGDLEHDAGSVGGKVAGSVTYDSSIDRAKDSEGYVNIHEQLNAGFEEAMFNEAEILQENPIDAGKGGYAANLLAPGSDMSITFKLALPEPCYGNFESSEDGNIFIWAEAV